MKLGVLFSDNDHSSLWERILPRVVNRSVYTKSGFADLINAELALYNELDWLRINEKDILLEDEVYNELISPFDNDNLYVIDTEFQETVFTRAELVFRGVYLSYIKNYDDKYFEGEISLSLKNKRKGMFCSLKFKHNNSVCETGTVSSASIEELEDYALMREFLKEATQRWRILQSLKTECDNLLVNDIRSLSREDAEKMILKLKNYPELITYKNSLAFFIA